MSVSASFPFKLGGRCIGVDVFGIGATGCRAATGESAPRASPSGERDRIAPVAAVSPFPARGNSETRGDEDTTGDCGGDTVVVLVASVEGGSAVSALRAFEPQERFRDLYFENRWNPNSTAGQLGWQCKEQDI